MTQELHNSVLKCFEAQLRKGEFDPILKLASEISSAQGAYFSFLKNGKWHFYPEKDCSSKRPPIGEDMWQQALTSDHSFVIETPCLQVGTPLKYEGQTMGILWLEDFKLKGIDPFQLRLLEGVAKNVQLALKLSQTEQETHARNEQFMDVQDMLQVGLWELDIETNSVKWSEGVYDIHQIPRGSEVDKISAISFYAEHERARISQLIEGAIKFKQPYDEVFEFYDSHKNRKWVRTIGKPVLNERSEVIRVRGTFQDVTAQRIREEEFREAQSIAKIGSWRYDFETQKQTWSSEHYKIFEIPEPQPQEILFKMYEERIHPEDRVTLNHVISRAMEFGEGFVLDHRVILDGGTRVKYVQGIAKVTRDREGKPLYISGTCRDRTHDIESEVKLKRLIENMSEAVMVKNHEGRIIECNPAASRILGYSREELLENPHLVFETISDDGSPIVLENYPSTLSLRTGREVRGVKMGLRKKGQDITWVIANAVPLETSTGRIVFTVLSDITDFIKASEENKFILETLGLGIWKFNIHDKSLYWDKSMYELFGVSPQEFSGHYEAWEKTLSPKDKERTVQLLNECIENRRDFNASFELEDSGRIIGARARLIADSNGNPTFMYGVNFDQTEESRIKEEYEKEKIRSFHISKLASIGEMAAGVGHEINNPLAIILGHALIMKMNLNVENQNDRALLERITKIEAAGERINKIIKGLKTFSRSDDEAFSDFCFSDCLIETIEMISPLYQKDNLSIDTQITPQLWMNGNFGRIQQIIINLFNNAKDAVEKSENKRIKISANAIEDKIVFVIHDFGCGMSQEVKSKIFEAFFTTKPVNKGTGIGLSIVQSIVAEHSGNIMLESEEGRGTMFKICLPLKVMAGDNALDSIA